MPKKRKRKIKLSPGFGSSLDPTTAKRAKELIRKRKLNDKSIARLMAGEGLPISAPYVGKLRIAMKLPTLPRSPRLAPAVVNMAKQLIAERKLDNTTIARLMSEEDLSISSPSVRKLRIAMGLPPFPKRSKIAPAVVKRARQLIRKHARLMAKEGLPISQPYVGKLRPTAESREKGKGAKAGEFEQVKKQKLSKIKSQDLGERLSRIDKVNKARVELEDQLTRLQSEKARGIILDELRNLNSLLKQLCKNVPEEALKERGINFGQNKK